MTTHGSNSFRNKVARRERAAIRAMQDGCVECIDKGGMCFECQKKAIEVFLDPRNELPKMEDDLDALPHPESIGGREAG